MSLAMSCGECAAKRSTSEPPEPTVAVPEESMLEDAEIFPVDERMLIREGLEDMTNRYSFTVMLTATVPGGEPRRCSGAVIAPRVVLTAAHCVCLRKRTGAPPHGLDCATRATVTTARYDSSKGVMANLLGGRLEDYEGTVRAHPDFKGLSNSHEVDSASPDLAIIMLDQPVAAWVRPVQLAPDEPKPGESIILVGYGRDETSDLTLGFRRFGKTKITASRQEGGTLEQQGLVALSSEGGAPCLREDGQDVVLLGMTSGYAGERPAFTSVPRYRDWLNSEIKQAAPSRPQDPSHE